VRAELGHDQDNRGSDPSRGLVLRAADLCHHQDAEANQNRRADQAERQEPRDFFRRIGDHAASRIPYRLRRPAMANPNLLSLLLSLPLSVDLCRRLPSIDVQVDGQTTVR
jgi:hypothetical protein